MGSTNANTKFRSWEAPRRIIFVGIFLILALMLAILIAVWSWSGTSYLSVETWSMCGTFFGGFAMAIAAVVAAGAWGAQSAESDAQRLRNAEQLALAGKRESIGRVGAAIVELTSGEVAAARDGVTTWLTSRRLKNLSTLGIREEKQRRQLFTLLWALHRLLPLSEDLQNSLPTQRTVLRVHINLIVHVLNSLEDTFSPAGKRSCEESWSAAVDSVNVLAESIEGLHPLKPLL